MDAALFLADLERKPARLAGLAAALRAGDPWGVSEPDAARSWVFVGMGSSAYAAQVAAARLRSHGVRAVAELASTHLLPQVDAGTTGRRRPSTSAAGSGRGTSEPASWP